MGNIVTTSNSRSIYDTKQPNFNAKPGSPEFYGLTQEQYDTWYKRASDISEGKNIRKHNSPIFRRMRNVSFSK